MATRSLLTGTALDPSGSPLPGANVRVRTAPPGQVGPAPIVTVIDEDVEVLSPVETNANDDGDWSLELYGTDDLTPAGTVYELSYKRGVTRYNPLYFDLPGGGATYWIGDRLIGAPGAATRTLEQIVLTPAAPSIAEGASVALRAIGHYDDGSTSDLTSACTWTSSNPAVATVGNTTGTKGIVTGVADGGAGITATDPVTALEGITSVAVTDPVTPPEFTFIGGMQVRYTGMTAADADLIKALGNTWVRVTVDFSVLAAAGNGGDPTAGLDLTLAGAAWPIIYAKTIGLNVLACCTYCPTWLSGGYHLIPQDSDQRDNWCEILTALMESSLYDYIDAIELWNEPNHFPFNGAGTAEAPTAVPHMDTIRPFMRAAVLAARAVDPDAYLMPGGPASARTRGPASGLDARVAKWDDNTPTAAATDLSLSPAHYLDQLYSPAGTAEDGTGIEAGTTPGDAWVNALAIHGYTGVVPPDYVHVGNPRWHAFNDVPGAGNAVTFPDGFNYRDDIVVARGDSTKPIWQTEGGFHGGAGGLSETDAANYLLASCVQWAEHQETGEAGPDCYFELRNNGLSNPADRTPLGTNPEEYLGMYHRFPDGSTAEKPQLSAWRAMCGVT